MRSNFLILCSAAYLLGAVSIARCAPVYNPATGHLYDIVSSGADGSWINAENNAIALGGHLVTINDAAEEAWLRAIFGTSTRYWIGFNDAAVEGTWVWASGEPVTYTNWDYLEPNNSEPPYGIGEDYAVLNWEPSDGGWNDWDHLRPDYDTLGPIDGIAEFGIGVAIDIKPMSCPNPLKVSSKGILPVAIVGTEVFNVTMVDPASVRLESVAPLRWSLEDVCTPFEPFLGKESELDCTEEGPDGFYDLTLIFDTQEIVEALGEVNDGEVLALLLEGNLREEYDGTPIVGEDVVIILKKSS